MSWIMWVLWGIGAFGVVASLMVRRPRDPEVTAMEECGDEWRVRCGEHVYRTWPLHDYFGSWHVRREHDGKDIYGPTAQQVVDAAWRARDDRDRATWVRERAL